jgi:hypothetical protein
MSGSSNASKWRVEECEQHSAHLAIKFARPCSPLLLLLMHFVPLPLGVLISLHLSDQQYQFHLLCHRVLTQFELEYDKLTTYLRHCRLLDFS